MMEWIFHTMEISFKRPFHLALEHTDSFFAVTLTMILLCFNIKIAFHTLRSTNQGGRHFGGMLNVSKKPGPSFKPSFSVQITYDWLK